LGPAQQKRELKRRREERREEKRREEGRKYETGEERGDEERDEEKRKDSRARNRSMLRPVVIVLLRPPGHFVFYSLHVPAPCGHKHQKEKESKLRGEYHTGNV
jgi:hypothetical protein